ncbi:MAG: ribonuclease HI [Legionellales bacterium]|nr:ribonuclease HI [Legionellales bacterium]
MEALETVSIYTDGACKGNPGPGGWGAILRCQGREKEIKGAEPMTTNNRMELTAAIEALASLNRRCTVALYTDSDYLRQGMQSWLAQWKKKGWRNSKNEAVKNIDLWMRLDELAKNHDIAWHWVKGHSGHPENERADQLANLAVFELNHS